MSSTPRRDLAGAGAGHVVVVGEHAREQARARFPGFKAARIVDEVRAALAAGRISYRAPAGLTIAAEERRRTLFAWTPELERVYALRPTADHFYVTTTLRPEAPQ